MKILVTGGAGFIGSTFVKFSIRNFKNDLKFSVLDKLTYAGNISNISDCLSNGKINFINGDICDLNLVRSIVKDYDLVVNFAAETHVDRSIKSPMEFLDSNVIGASNLGLSCMEEDIPLIQISTDEVYGSIVEGSWNENSPLQPNSPYAASKSSADMILMSYFKTHGLNVKITRCCNNYGPFQNPEKVIPHFITNLIQKKSVPVYGDGNNIREWIHVEDHCRAIWLVINSARIGDIVNIGSGFEISNNDLVNFILNKMEMNDSYIKYVPDRLGHDRRYSLDSHKLKSMGFDYIYDFKTGMDQTIKWYKENTVWWKPLVSKI